MTRSQLLTLPEYFDRYILKCDDVTVCQAIRKSIEELENAPLDKWEALGNKVYAEGKWTVKDILQHLIDTERIFCYRALCYARGETNAVLGYDEDAFANVAMASKRSLKSLVNELQQCHLSTYHMFESFDDECMARMCIGFKGKYSVAAAGFILPGHQRWHFDILQQRYYPLLQS